MVKFYNTIFNLVALTVVIYVGVDIFYRVIRPELRQIDVQEIAEQQVFESEQKKDLSLRDFRPITDRNLSGSIDKVIKDADKRKTEAAVPTSLKIALLGTVTGDEENAYAVIEEITKRKQGLYMVGDSVQNAIVKMILRGKVILRVGNNDEVLTMEESASSRPAPGRSAPVSNGDMGTTITVRRAELRRSLRDISTLLSQVHVQPHFTDGRADGLALTRIEADSIFSRLGLKDGDVVREINGRAIKSAEDIVTSYRKFRSGSRASIAIMRDNKFKTIHYRFR